MRLPEVGFLFLSIYYVYLLESSCLGNIPHTLFSQSRSDSLQL